MSNQLQEDGSFINSIVGEGTTFRGDLDLSGLLRIDGDFSGTIRTTGKVLVGVNGRAECTISAGTVVIGGVVKGNIYAVEKVLVLSTGMMVGNINTPRLIAEEGVVLHGSCLVRRETRSSAEAESTAPLDQLYEPSADPERDVEPAVATIDVKEGKTASEVEGEWPANEKNGEERADDSAAVSATSESKLGSWNV